MMPVRRNQQWLPSIFNDFFDNNYIAKANNTAPAVNVIENDTDYRVELAVPGMTKDDFKVKLDLSERQREMLKAGGLLNYTRENNK